MGHAYIARAWSERPVNGISMYRVEEGRIAEIWETRNTLGILRQLDPRMRGGHHH